MSQASWLWTLLFVILGSMGLSLFLTPLVRLFAIRRGIVSRPTQERWGHRVVPRLGGLPIALAFLITVGFHLGADPRLLGLLLAGILMLLTGVLDDVRPLHPYTKLIVQIIAGCLVVLTEIQFRVRIPWLVIPVTIGWLVLTMNAFNLMDNMDGLAAGIGVIAAFFCAWHAWQSNQWVVALLCASLGGSTLGFLAYNLPPAKIFMGDTGSQLLGLGLGSLTILGTWTQPTRLLGIVALPTLLLAVPIFDTCFVTVQRIIHGRHPFQGGTDHLSHRLGILGLTPRQVVFTLYTLTALLGALSLLLTNQQPLSIAGIGLLVVGALLMLGASLGKVQVYVGQPPSDSRVTLLETMLMHKRRIVEVIADFVFIWACYVTAHNLRFEANLSMDLVGLVLKSLPWIIAVKMVCFFVCGLYRGVWRYIGLSDLFNILKAVILSSILSAIVVLYLWRFEGYSRAVFIIDGVLLFLAVSGARLVEPMLNEWIHTSAQGKDLVLIVGAGDTGELLLQHLKLERDGKRRVAGFLDDDPSKWGDRIHGTPILGSRRDMGRIVKELGVREVFIAIRRPPEELVRQIQGYCEENSLKWKIATPLAPAEPSAPPQG